ncbi:MAG: hypothetical protein ACLS40_11835 [Lachnospiraceae bacterium]
MSHRGQDGMLPVKDSEPPGTGTVDFYLSPMARHRLIYSENLSP